LKVREVKKVSKIPNVVTLSIPLNEKISTILKDVKDIVETKQIDKLVGMGLNPLEMKSKVVNQSKYSFA
jgi:hypothetical protein